MTAVVGAVRYASVEDVKHALDTQFTARMDAQILADIESHTETVEGFLHRKFWPCIDTRYWDWPNLQYAWPFTLHLESDELLSVTTLTSGGTTIPAQNYFLEPNRSGPPYYRLEIDLTSNSSFGGSSGTWQRNIAITGVFGAWNRTVAAGTLTAGINASATTITVSDSSLVGVGPAILVGGEYMTVEARTMVSTGTTIAGNLTLSQTGAGITVPVADGTKVNAGETILVDAERMLVQDVIGNSLNVKRAWDGTPLAAHTTGATIYAPRQLTVVRGCWGTTAAAHLQGDAIGQHAVPALIRDLTVAEVIVHAQWMSAGGTEVMQRGGVAGSDATGAKVVVRRTDDIRADAYARWGRKARKRAV